MKERDFLNKLKRHPELFDIEKDSAHHIDERDIPPIPKWFYDIKEKEQLKNKKKYKSRILVAITTCAVIVFVLLITPLGKTLANSLYNLFVSWSDDSSAVSIYYGSETNFDFAQESPLPTEQKYNDTQTIRKQYEINFAENEGRFPDTIAVAEIDGLGYKIDLIYNINSNTVVITNLSYFTAMEHGGAVAATSEDYKPIDTKLLDGTKIVGIYDKESAIATGYFDNLEVTIHTDDLSYDEFLKFIESTTIK